VALFPPSFLDDLKTQANILRVVQEYVTLRGAGNSYKGLCPFHSEKTPSFTVTPDRGTFKCFGCGAGGDAIKFIELHERVNFVEAVKLLAQKVGMPVPEVADNDESRRDAGLREAFLKMHEIAAVYFREQLEAPGGARARQQLKDRALTAQTIEQLGLGFAPRDGLKARLAAQGFNEALLLQSGLIVRRDTGEIVDRFRNRLMVPICRDSGSVIAFGGRKMDEAQGGPKYLNSPETPIYTKGKTLYGLNLTKSAIAKLGYAVIVEGYFDFAQVFQSQAAPVVASCGTALTTQQAQLLRRFSKKVVLSFDPDAAGQGAAVKSCELLVGEGFDVNVLALDRGEDPDTFIRRQGGDQYPERLRFSRPYLEYLIDQAAKGVDFERDEQRRQFLHKMLSVAARIPDVAARDQFADRIAHKARVTEGVVRSEIRKAAVNRKTELTTRELPALGELKPAEKSLIWNLIHNTSEALSAIEALEEADFSLLASRDIFELARSLKDTDSEGLPSVLLQRLSTVDAQLVRSTAASTTPHAAPADCIRALRRLRFERELAAVQRDIDQAQSQGGLRATNEIDALLRKKNDLGLWLEGLT
jgi:DNA primase